MINPSFSVSGTDIQNFREHGFLKLKGIFSLELIEHMQKLCTSEVAPPSDNYGKGFSKLKYDVGNDDPTVLDVMRDETFSTAIAKLTGQQLFFTQGLGFELAKGKSTGFPWHVGNKSFGFQRRQDAGFTVWTPLCNIDAQGQRGGMKYVSKQHLSGEFVYQHFNLVPEYCKSEVEAGRDLTYEDFSTLKDGPLNSPSTKALLDHFAVEDSFELGDALLFDKYVLHRSIKLEEGPIPSRLAYALRFCSVDARYDKRRVENLAAPRTTFNYDIGRDFNDKVATEDGELVYASPYFDGTREARTLRAPREA